MARAALDTGVVGSWHWRDGQKDALPLIVMGHGLGAETVRNRISYAELGGLKTSVPPIWARLHLDVEPGERRWY